MIDHATPRARVLKVYGTVADCVMDVGFILDVDHVQLVRNGNVIWQGEARINVEVVSAGRRFSLRLGDVRPEPEDEVRVLLGKSSDAEAAALSRCYACGKTLSEDGLCGCGGAT